MWDMEGRGNNASAVEEINSTVDYEVFHFPNTLVLKVILLPILSQQKKKNALNTTTVKDLQFSNNKVVQCRINGSDFIAYTYIESMFIQLLLLDSETRDLP